MAISLRKIGTSSSAKLEEPSTKLSLEMIGSSFQSKMVTVVDDHRDKKKMPMNNNNPVPHIDLTLEDDDDDDDDDLPVQKKVIEVGGGSSSRGGNEGRRAIPLAPNSRRSVQEIMERRRINRVISNRLSAKRSRVKKNEYVAEMERQAKHLETKINMLHPQVLAFQHHRRLLLIEQNEMKFRMALVEHDRLLKERKTEKMKEEIMRLLEFKKRQEQIRAEEMKTWGADISLMSPNPDPADPSKPTVIASTSSPVKG
ncbi:hypothetical protein QN277_018003 [Acacia crassicarpa]|uniref:BZIP domain-containing protein n=1 Tax=Acacia crassicarpa TaxID=499986 RepID=A0AAE1JSH8_9FABA|nr:hypothetical protein QN277_018003 [Acacia crassicarpa]